jgi:hypothetical protein
MDWIRGATDLRTGESETRIPCFPLKFPIPAESGTGGGSPPWSPVSRPNREVDEDRGVDARCPHGSSTAQDGTNIPLMKEKTNVPSCPFQRRVGGVDNNTLATRDKRVPEGHSAVLLLFGNRPRGNFEWELGIRAGGLGHGASASPCIAPCIACQCQWQ